MAHSETAVEYAQLDEADLTRRAAVDREALAALVERHAPLAVTYACSLVRNRDDALDAAQTALLQLAQKMTQGWRDGSVKAWLYIATRHAVFNLRAQNASRRRREEVVAAAAEASAIPMPADPLENQESLAALREELLALPAETSAVIVLHHLEDLPLAEVARQMQQTEGACKQRLARGREQLREKLQRRGVACASSGLCVAMLQTHFTAAKSTVAGLGPETLTSLVNHALAGAGATAGAAALGAGQAAAHGSVLKSLGVGLALLLAAVLGLGAFWWTNRPSPALSAPGVGGSPPPAAPAGSANQPVVAAPAPTSPSPVSWQWLAGKGLPDSEMTGLILNGLQFDRQGALYAGFLNHGLYRSGDGGANWQPASAGLDRAARLSGLYRNDRGELLAALYGDDTHVAGAAILTENATEWARVATPVKTPGIGMLVFCAAPQGRVLMNARVAAGENTLNLSSAVSQDGGRSSGAALNAVPNDGYASLLACNPKTGSWVMATAEDCYELTAAGGTWTPLSVALPAMEKGRICSVGFTAGGELLVGCAGSNQNSPVLWRANADGRMTPADTGLPRWQSPRSLVCTPQGWLLCLVDGRVFASGDHAQTWRPLGTGAGGHDVTCLALGGDGRLFAGTRSGQIACIPLELAMQALAARVDGDDF